MEAAPPAAPETLSAAAGNPSADEAAPLMSHWVEPGAGREAAAAGVKQDGGPLPHLEAIQRSFGPAHDLGKIHAHVGGAAAHAADALGAAGYANGEGVAFGAAPDLRLAAHEAAHVVQQRAGVPLAGGRPAGHLLGEAAAGRDGGGAPQLQLRPKEAKVSIGAQVRAAVGRGDLLGDGTGAYYLLNGLNPDELVRTLQGLPAGTRKQLLDHINEAAQGYDRPRLEAALRAAAGPRRAATQTVSAVDEVRGEMGQGGHAQALARLAVLPPRQLDGVLVGMDVDQVRALEEHLDEAPVGDQERLRVALSRRHRQAFADRITEAIARGDYGGDGTGAFYLLNGLSPSDLTQTLQQVGKPARAQLLAHIAQADQGYDRPRLESALRVVAGGQRTASESISILDQIREAQREGSFASVMEGLGAMNRVRLNQVLGALDTASLQVVLQHVGEAPAEAQARLRDVLADLLGTPRMAPADVIDVEGLRGLERTMAELYNTRGQLIAAEAAGLGIDASVAAGIMQAEAGGRTFGETTDRPIARLEVHVLWDRWGHTNQREFNQHYNFQRSGDRTKDHVWRADVAGTWRPFHGNQEAEWQVIDFTAQLAGQEIAYQSASFGAGQTMGFNHNKVGAASAVEMVEQYAQSERAQVGGIFSFIRNTRGMTEAVRRGDYLTLARGYNGNSRHAQGYADNIERYTTIYRRVTSRRTGQAAQPEAPGAAAPAPAR